MSEKLKVKGLDKLGQPTLESSFKDPAFGKWLHKCKYPKVDSANRKCRRQRKWTAEPENIVIYVCRVLCVKFGGKQIRLACKTARVKIGWQDTNSCR